MFLLLYVQTSSVPVQVNSGRSPERVTQPTQNSSNNVQPNNKAATGPSSSLGIRKKIVKKK